MSTPNQDRSDLTDAINLVESARESLQAIFDRRLLLDKRVLRADAGFRDAVGTLRAVRREVEQDEARRAKAS